VSFKKRRHSLNSVCVTLRTERKASVHFSKPK
jgi:hypothetical protein